MLCYVEDYIEEGSDPYVTTIAPDDPFGKILNRDVRMEAESGNIRKMEDIGDASVLEQSNDFQVMK